MDSTGGQSPGAYEEGSPRMHKIRGGKEKQDEWLAAVADLEPRAIQAVLVERAKQAALAMAVAV